MTESYNRTRDSRTLPTRKQADASTDIKLSESISPACHGASSSSCGDEPDASPVRLPRPRKVAQGNHEEMLSYQPPPVVSLTLPSGRRLGDMLNQTSFNSISSSESCPDAANTSLETSDAIPSRIERMPLFTEDYIKNRQASVENLLSSSAPRPSAGKDDDHEDNPAVEPKETDELLSFYSACSNFVNEPSGSDRTMKQNGKSLHPPSALPVLGNGMEYGILGRRASARRDVPLQQTDNAPSTSSTRKGKNESNYTEVDLTARRQPKPMLKGPSSDCENSERLKSDQEPNQNTQESAIISTPPRNYPIREEKKYPNCCCCDNTCSRLCCALIYWKTLCQRFSVWDIGMTIVSIGIFFFDVVTDLLLSLTYYHQVVEDEDFRIFFGLTLGFVVGPSVIVQAFSFYWVVDDYRHKKAKLNEHRKDEKIPLSAVDVISLFFSFILHFLQMAILFSYQYRRPLSCSAGGYAQSRRELIHIFCFFNVHEEKEGRTNYSRCRMFIFYTVVLMESSVLSVLWFFFRSGGDPRSRFRELGGIWQSNEQHSTPSPILPKNAAVIQQSYALGLLVAVHGLFMLGMVFMICYYALLHPRNSNNSCCWSQPRKHQQPSETSSGEFGTKVVSAPEECMALTLPDDHQTSAKADAFQKGCKRDTGSTSVALRPSHGYPLRYESSQSLQTRQESQDSLRRRKRRLVVSEIKDSDQERSPSLDSWSQTVFNRKKRTNMLYTKQYSREKSLDDIFEKSDEELSPRQTERFAAVVTPTREHKSTGKPPINRCVAPTLTQNTCKLATTKPTRVGPPMQSIVIQPGSQGATRRSATHHLLGSYTLGSPLKEQKAINTTHSLNTSPVRHSPGVSGRPQPIGSRGYSASMSSLVEENPLSYTTRRRQALYPEARRPFTPTLRADEVMESMETSV